MNLPHPTTFSPQSDHRREVYPDLHIAVAVLTALTFRILVRSTLSVWSLRHPEQHTGHYVWFILLHVHKSVPSTDA